MLTFPILTKDLIFNIVNITKKQILIEECFLLFYILHQKLFIHMIL